MLEALQYPFFRRALIAGLLASVACGIMGTYVVVKRISSISGSLSHTAFGGVGLGYLLGFNPIFGAAAFGVASSIGIGVAYRRMRGSLDTLLAMIWSIGMALGILFISLTPGYAPDLMSYLFGSILFVPLEFIYMAAVLDLVVVTVVALFYKEFLAVAFDEEFAEVLGIPVGPILCVLLALIAISVVTLIRVVGIIMVIALLTFPAAIARHWSNHLVWMMAGAAAIAGFCTSCGLFMSFWISKSSQMQVPTGPLIILVAAVLYVASSILSKKKARS